MHYVPMFHADWACKFALTQTTAQACYTNVFVEERFDGHVHVFGSNHSTRELADKYAGGKNTRVKRASYRIVARPKILPLD